MRLIDADKLRPDVYLSKRGDYAISLQQINFAPTVEITEGQAIGKLHETGWLPRHDKEMTERPTGYWINMKADDLRINDYQCSNCGNWSDEGKEYFPFCWRCGADMRGGTQ